MQQRIARADEIMRRLYESLQQSSASTAEAQGSRWALLVHPVGSLIVFSAGRTSQAWASSLAAWEGAAVKTTLLRG